MSFKLAADEENLAADEENIAADKENLAADEEKHLIASENMDLFFTLTCRDSRAFAEIILELS